MSSDESGSEKEVVVSSKKQKAQKINNDEGKKRKKAAKKVASESDSDSDVSLPAKERNRPKGSAAVSAPTKKQKVEDGETDGRFPLGSKRFVSVNEWKGRKQIDIREFYLADNGDMKPGKKGISLSEDQFKKLLDYIPNIKAKLAE